MRYIPHLTYLQAFEAAARHLSFTRAGKELNCTQAAISQRIRGLEQHFGRPLFFRKANGLELSSAGAAYLPGITQALDVMDAATRGLTGRRSEQTITISAPISFFNRCLSPLLPEFTAAHPAIGLRLNSSIWTDPNLDLADLSLSFGERTMRPSDAIPLAAAPVTKVTTARVCDPVRRRIEVQGKFPLWDLWREKTTGSFDTDLPPYRVDTADTALHLAVQGLGHAVIYDLYAQGLSKAGAIATTLPVEIGHVLLLQPNPTHRVRNATQTFIDWLVTRFRSIEPVP